MGILDAIPLVHAAEGNYGAARKASDIRYLVYHYTANDGDKAANNVSYYAKNVVQASAHYFVDDDGVKQSVPDLTVAWAVGGKKWNDCAQTGGGTLYGVCTNTNSLSIELCDTRKDGTLMATEQTLTNAVALGKLLMEKYGIPIERVIRHFDVTGKHCPAYFMDEGKWAAFKARLVAKEPTEKEPVEKAADVKRYNTVSELPKWSRDTIQKLLDKGILTGGTAGLDLSMDMLRLLVINDRAGLYGK